MSFRTRIIGVAAGLALAGFAGAADATPLVDYNLTLTPNSGTAPGGTGFLQVDGPINQIFADYGLAPASPVAGVKYLDQLSFTIDGHTFDLGDHIGTVDVQFISGALSSILYFGVDNGNFQISLSSSGLSYSYASQVLTNNQWVQVSGTGTVSAALAGDPPGDPRGGAVPEPISLSLLGAGLAGLAGLRRRRRV